MGSAASISGFHSDSECHTITVTLKKMTEKNKTVLFHRIIASQSPEESDVCFFFHRVPAALSTVNDELIKSLYNST